MALIPPRSAADDRRDALAALAALERELPNLRAQLTADLDPATMWQARRVALIVAAEATDVAKHAGHAAERAAHRSVDAPPLKSVS